MEENMGCFREYDCFECIDRDTLNCPLDDRYFGDSDNFEYDDFYENN
jgi:hypothetical protein